MEQLIKSNIRVMGRNIWIEPLDSDRDIQYIKMLIEERLKSVFEQAGVTLRKEIEND